MIEPAPNAARAKAPERLPVLLDFCAAFERRHPGRALCAFYLVKPETGAAVSEFRRSLGLTMAEAARAARVGAAQWARIECPPKNRIERAAPVWRALTWVMAMGGPNFPLAD